MGGVWFVTGASRGLGRAVAKVALARGDRVVITAKDVDSIEGLAKDTSRALAVELDVTDEAQVARAIQVAMEWSGRIDVVVNNAGIGLIGSVEGVSFTQVNRLFEVNVLGSLRVIRAVLPHLREQRRGLVIQISSTSGSAASSGGAIYAGTKWAMEGVAEGLAREIESFGIGVSLVVVGAMRTDFLEKSTERAPVFGKDGKLPAPARADALDPRDVAEQIFELSRMRDAPLRIAVGPEARAKITGALRKRLADLA